ncbi:MAG TPA: hypothetical protein V6D11_12510 [Waterburya sp.]
MQAVKESMLGEETQSGFLGCAIALSLPLDWTVENEKKPCESIM